LGSFDGYIQKVIDLGARDYLVKSFSEGYLQFKVARALRNTLEDPGGTLFCGAR
jgi:DNA-binding response OmpR family regulator